jgi:uncharacterized protein
MNPAFKRGLPPPDPLREGEHRMRNYTAKEVDDYIASSAPEARPTLVELRKLVRGTIPEVEEGISWGVPFYRYHGLLAGYSVFKSHVTFGLTAVLDSDLCAALEAKGYKTGKKTIQIRFNQKIPAAAIKQILKTRAKLNEAKQRERGKAR